MARILYGVSGDGSGHASRAKEVIRFLKENEHEVVVVGYGKSFENLKEEFSVKKITGLFLSYRENEVEYFKTLFKSFLAAPETIKSLNDLLELVKNFKPQIIISDFEPLTSLVAKLKNIPLISIDNQHLISRTKYFYPKKYHQEAIVAKMIIKSYVFRAKEYLVLSFFETEIKDRRTKIFPPILRREILRAKTTEKDFVLVYLNNKSYEIIKILKRVNQKFVVYGFDFDKIDENIFFKKRGDDFIEDLKNCHAIIATAGFSLISEALYLNKPLLVIPIVGQFEQVLNAYYLEKEGYGKYWDDLNQERVEAFLFNWQKYKNNLKSYKKEDNSKVFNRLNELIESFL